MGANLAGFIGVQLMDMAWSVHFALTFGEVFALFSLSSGQPRLRRVIHGLFGTTDAQEIGSHRTAEYVIRTLSSRENRLLFLHPQNT
jgi:hypothetical protein